MMSLLGIDSLRRGADGDPASAHAANYDEARANTRLASMPALLQSDAGGPITSAEAWWSIRRPQLVAHFEREIYGHVPPGLPEVRWHVAENRRHVIAGVPVVTETVIGSVASADDPALSVSIPLRVTLPAAATRAVPVIVELSSNPEFEALLRQRFGRDAAPGPNEAEDWHQQAVRRGWGFARLDVTAVQGDNGAELDEGIIGLGNRGRPRAPSDWGALRAWAWAASRVVDYFGGVGAIDETRVGVAGHSRFGKAALLAMAFDTRFAVAYISSSGEGGAKLWRRNFGEQVGNVAGSGEYHWVAGNFLRYAGPLTVDDLPVDGHALIALCAPRPVFIGAGSDGDKWVDPKGMFLAAALASPVYELLGADPLESTSFPGPGPALIRGDVAFRQHEGGHTPHPNWPYFMDFAARYFGISPDR